MRTDVAETHYGFRVGDTVTARVQLADENGATVQAGTALRIVAIAPKVRYTAKHLITSEPERYDSKVYFVNLVRAGQTSFLANRFREHFVTIKKLKTI